MLISNIMEKYFNSEGHHHLFKSGVNMALILETNTNSDVYKTIIERRDLFDLKGVPDEHPHLTLHMINFNFKHPLIDEGFLKEIKAFTKKCYIEILHGYKLIKDDFAILGKINDPTFVMKYKLNYPDRITKFRICIYNEIARLLNIGDYKGFKDREVRKVNKKDMFIYSTPDGIPVYGIHQYYHGKGNWEPHISLFKLREVQLSSAQEIGKILFNESNYSKINRNNLSKVKPIRGEPNLSFEDLVLKENHFGKIKISMIGALKDIEYTGTKKKRRRKTRRTKSRKKRIRKRNTKKRKKSRRKKTKSK